MKPANGPLGSEPTKAGAMSLSGRAAPATVSSDDRPRARSGIAILTGTLFSFAAVLVKTFPFFQEVQP